MFNALLPFLVENPKTWTDAGLRGVIFELNFSLFRGHFFELNFHIPGRPQIGKGHALSIAVFFSLTALGCFPTQDSSFSLGTPEAKDDL